jgi:hypothetical protein
MPTVSEDRNQNIVDWIEIAEKAALGISDGAIGCCERGQNGFGANRMQIRDVADWKPSESGAGAGRSMR